MDRFRNSVLYPKLELNKLSENCIKKYTNIKHVTIEMKRVNNNLKQKVEKIPIKECKVILKKLNENHNENIIPSKKMIKNMKQPPQDKVETIKYKLCEICLIVYPLGNLFDQHVKKKHGENYYQCKLCNKYYPHEFLLRKHIRTNYLH